MEDHCFRLTREGLCMQEEFTFALEERITDALAPAAGEEIIVTFTKRKRR